jgi:WD40 repeat protein
VSLLDGSVHILDPSTAQTRRTLHPLGIDDTVSLAFAPNGTLATGTLKGIVQLWNPTSGAQIARPLSVTPSPVRSITFDPVGQRFATTGGQDGTVKLWNTATLQPEGTALNTDQGFASTAEFEPGGRALVAITDRGSAFTWPTTIAAWKQRACSVARRNLTREEWSRYLPSYSYAQTCP